MSAPSARNSATVRGSAGRETRPRSEHHAPNRDQLVRYARSVASALEARTYSLARSAVACHGVRVLVSVVVIAVVGVAILCRFWVLRKEGSHYSDRTLHQLSVSVNGADLEEVPFAPAPPPPIAGRNV